MRKGMKRVLITIVFAIIIALGIFAFFNIRPTGKVTGTTINVSVTWLTQLVSSNNTPMGYIYPSVAPTIINVQLNSYPLRATLDVVASGTGYISGYEFYLDGSSLIGYVSYAGYASPPGYSASTSYSFTTPGIHTYSAAVYDASGNKISTPTYAFDFEPTCSSGQTACSGSCVSIQTDSNNCGACGNVCSSGHSCQSGSCITASDTTSPTVSITSPAGGSIQSGTITLTATASDNVGVTGVQFKIDGLNLGAEDTSSPYSISWNTASYTNANHVITSVARDAAGNTATSTGVTVSVNNALPDTTQPSLSGGIPSGSLSSNTTQVTMQVTTNEASTCKYSTNAGVAYSSMPSTFTTTGGTTHTKTVTGLSSGLSYNYYVKCQDSAGNANTADYTISFYIQTCGNGVINSGEQCDGSDFGGQTCITMGFSSGTLLCSSSCTLNTTICMSTASDTTLPTVSITSPAGGSTQSGTITLTATASDNVGVTGVQFKIDGLNIGAEDTSSPYSISWNTASYTNANHVITSVARDAAGNTATSTGVTVSVNNALPDTTPPVRSNGLPTGTLAAGTTSTLISLGTNEAATCKYSATSGTAYSSMANTFTTTGSTLHSVLVSGLIGGNTYNYYIRCIDAAGNANTNDYTIIFSVSAAPTIPSADITSPSVPLNLAASAVSSSLINLSWSVSTDNVGVIGYGLERCQGSSCTSFVQISTPTATLYSDIGLVANTTYRYHVRAQDAANNPSGYSSIASATTQQASTNLSTDTTVPSTPTNLAASAVSSSRINLLWSASTDNVGVIGYRIERCQGSSCTSFVQIATPTGNSYSDIGLAVGTAYRYRVRAQDAANNPSVYSSIASATTQQAITTQQTNVTTSTEIIPSATEILKERTYSGLDITPSFPTTIRDFSSAMAVEQITINVNNLAQDVEVTVKTHDSKPAEVSVKKSGKIYQYLQIDMQNLNANLNKATVEFKVEKNWVSINGLSKDKISVYKFDETGKKWNELQTALASEDNKYYYYSVELNSFSYFAIAEKEAVTISNIGGENWLLWSLIFAVAFVLALIIWRLSARKQQFY